MTNDLSLDLYLHKELKLHRGHIQFLGFFLLDWAEQLPKHKFLTDLEKSGYVYDGVITTKGRDLMKEIEEWQDVYEPKGKIRKKKIEFSEEFLKWWDTFPVTDNFEYAGVSFTGVQSKKSNKEECAVAFEQAALEVGADKMQKALEYELEGRKDQSVIRKENLLTWMSGTKPYLNKKGYLSYLPLIERGSYIPKSKAEVKEVIDTKEIF